MGFGKYLLGSMCAVGAVIAAPVMLPAAGLMAAPVLVNVVPTGIIAGKVHEKKIKEEARKEGYVEASREYEEKIRLQAKEFLEKKGKWEIDRNQYEELLNQYATYIKELEEENAAIEKVISIRKEYNDLLSLQRCS